ncbi:colipase-like protein 2 [Centruroides vittatus]|uniref:colipase-like protein 2 n=1 Tax=Centruroides vittatus TaxID=120091 RepID=UPI00350F3700
MLPLMFAILFSVAFGEVKFCENHAECDRDQCCVRPFQFATAICQPLVKQGKFCLPKILSLQEGVNMMACPCASGLECVAEKVTESGDKKTYHKPTCRKSR